MLSSVSCFLILLLLRFSTDPPSRLRGHSRPLSYDQGGWKGGPGPAGPSWFLNDGTNICFVDVLSQCDNVALGETKSQVFVDNLALRDKLNVVACVLLSYFSSLLFLHRSSVAT